jgi:release factor glutamine methyltransferase
MTVTTPPRSLIDVVRLSTGYLEHRGCESPRLDAELLAAHALGVSRIDIYLQFDRPLDDAELSAIRELVRRRGSGEPIAYITSEREFYGRPFRVSPAVLIPRPETETLVERALVAARAAGPGARIADLGTGSGCVALTLAAELPEVTVVATDVSEDALAVAAENAERLGLSGRVTLHHASWAEGLQGPLDVVVSNPPYITLAEMAELDPGVRDHEPEIALTAGEDGLDAFRALLTSLTVRPGWLGLEVDPRRAGAVADLVRQRWPGTEAQAVNDLTGRPRVVETVPVPPPSG